METPLELEVHGFSLSAHLREIVDANIAKLERHYGRITAGRIVIRAPDAHHRMGEPYKVTIHLTLPGRREVSVKPQSGAADRRHAQAAFAMTDAFRRADRQLDDQAARRKGRPNAKMAAGET